MISVIIPHYNRPLLLDRCLNSLVLQTSNNFEVVFVDDGSTTPIDIVLNKYKTLLDMKVIFIPNSGGPAKPRNLGIQNASFDWIALLDCDDWFSSDKIKKSIDYILKYNDVDFIYHQLRVVNEENKHLKIIGTDFKTRPFESLMYYGDSIPTSSVVFNRKLIKMFGFFNESHEFSSVEDYDLWLTFALNGVKFKFINEILGYYFFSKNGISFNVDNTIKKNGLVLEKYIPFLDDDFKKYAINRYNYSCGSIALSHLNFKLAISYFLKSFFQIGFKRNFVSLLKLSSAYVRSKIYSHHSN